MRSTASCGSSVQHEIVLAFIRDTKGFGVQKPQLPVLGGILECCDVSDFSALSLNIFKETCRGRPASILVGMRGWGRESLRFDRFIAV